MQYKPYTSKKHMILSKKFIAALLLLILIAVGTFYLIHKHNSNQVLKPAKTHIDYSPAKPSDNAASEARKNNTTPNKNGSTGQTLNNTGDSPSFSVSITGANIDKGSNTLYVGSLVNGEISGTCTLTFSKAGASNIVLTNNVTLQNSSYVCPVFSESVSKFPSPGQWQATLDVVNGNSKATDKTEFTI